MLSLGVRLGAATMKMRVAAAGVARFDSAVLSGAVRGMTAFAQPQSAMSCMQCEQRAGDGCSVVGVCGKDPTTAALQDLLLHQIKAISVWADAGRQRGVSEEALKAANEFTVHALFSTLTNVNFDASRFVEYSREAEKVRQALEALVTHRLSGAEVGALPSVAHFAVKSSLGQAELAALGRTVGLEARETPTTDHDVFGASEMVMYGVKGVAAYAAHALALGRTDPAVYSGVHRALRTISDPKIDLSTALATALDVGGTNVKTMQLLSDAHRGQFGVPEPTAINHAATAGHAILVSGHDLHDLHEILTQTEGKGVNVYTHGEMLPAHTYPGLKKFKHLVGHFGGPWQLQRFEFAKFPGAIVMTTNCIIEPQSRYRDRIFTKNEVGWEGTAHIRGNDYSPVIKAAKAMPGFARTEPERRIMGGFGHEAVLANAGTILDAVQKGNLKHIALVGGCDGTEGDRSYYTDFAKALPPTSAILTLGCGKFRVIGRGDYGNIPGTAIPRVLDMGQCNDSYSAVVVALKLAEALKTDINSLPLSLTLSHLEQKALAVLLSLFHLGVKNIRLGPRPPAFVTPNILKVLQDKFNLQLIDTSAGVADAERIAGRA